nr:hypothetical protein BaRGS_033829 [Batillaria attramentaria]
MQGIADVKDEEVAESNDYAVVDDDTEEIEDLRDIATSTDDYVPISKILERKKQTQFEDVPDDGDKGDDNMNVPKIEGSTLSLDLKMFDL